MRVLHVIPSLSPIHGGPSVALPLMARALRQQGIDVDVVTTDDDGPGRRMTGCATGTWLQEEGFRATYFPKQTEFYKTSLPLALWLWRHARDYDLVHIHALFSFTSNAAAWIARLRGVPYIIRPLGLLNQWGMENRRRWIKQASFNLIERPVLRTAAAIHYTSGQEAREATRLRLGDNGRILPLGADLSALAEPADHHLFDQSFPARIERPTVLFLSRIDPKKGLELLIDAFASLLKQSPGTAPRPVLLVAGQGEPGYTDELRQKVRELDIEDDVIWTGRLEGELKRSALAAADVFALPSQSENFGIALLEAMASGKACVSSPEVALAEDVRDTGAVSVVNRDPMKWTAELKRLLAGPAARSTLGHRAREIANERYSLTGMGEGLKALYRRIIQGDALAS